ncbi:GH25 family lysozyme [Kitasatospora sp. NPDC001683]
MANARGYDVSDYQSSIPDDAEFVIVKASEGARTEQTGYAAKVAEARRRNIIVGHYHFIHCENDVQGEIDHFCRVVGPVPAGELLVLDFEPYGQPVSDSAATAAKNAWLAAVKARYPNNRVGLYTSVDWWHRTDDNCANFLWIADYVTPGSPRIQAPWRFHQFTDAPLDTNVYCSTIDDLRVWAGASAPAPSPGPAAPGPWMPPGRVTRDQWGAVAPSGSYTPMTGALGVKVHYLGESYTFDDHATCAAYVRKVQAAHMADPKEHWLDIAYNELVCEHGYRFEGRGHNVWSGANGNTELNAQHYAICALLGSTGSTVPTDAQLNGLRDAIEDYQANAAAGPEIRGHRDGYPTDCPGGPLYAWVQAGAPRPNAPSQEDDMPITDDDAAKIAHVIWNYHLPHLRDDWTADGDLAAYWFVAGKDVSDRANARAFAELQTTLTAQTAAITALAAQITAQHPDVDTAAVVAAVQQAIASATVHVQVDVAGTPASTTAPATPTS